MKTIKRLASCIRQYKLYTILTPLFMVGEVIFELLIPYLMSEKILGYLATVTTSPDIGYLLKWGVILIGCACVSFTCGTLSGVYCAKASAGFASNLRHDLFYKVQTFSFSNVDKFSTSSLVTRLTTDVSNVQNAFMMIIRTAVRAPLMMIFSLVFSLKTFTRVGAMQTKQMATVYGIVIPLLILGLASIMAVVMPFFNKIFKKYDALNESVQENVKGMRVVKAYVREEYEKQKFDKASEEVRKDFTKAEKILAFNNPIMMACMYATMLSVIVICGKAGIFGGQKYVVMSSLQSLISYSMSALMSFMMLSMIFVMVTMAVASARRICEVLDEKSDIENPQNPVYNVEDGSVEFINVNFKYNSHAEKYALSDINLKIKSGETIGIIGGTGSSKTSLINLISRLYDATEGVVKVGGKDVKDYDLDTLRNQVAVVLQKNLLFSGTIAENIRWGDLNAPMEEVKRVCRLAQAEEFIEGFPDKYETRIEQGGTNVSGGQKQRLCIARALLKKPKILILDDSTSAVDTKTDALIRHALKTELPEVTKIIIAQRTASVQDADKIIVMENGKINGVGTHEELLKNNAIYQEVYNTQNRVGEQGGEL